MGSNLQLIGRNGLDKKQNFIYYRRNTTDEELSEAIFRYILGNTDDVIETFNTVVYDNFDYKELRTRIGEYKANNKEFYIIISGFLSSTELEWLVDLVDDTECEGHISVICPSLFRKLFSEYNSWYKYGYYPYIHMDSYFGYVYQMVSAWANDFNVRFRIRNPLSYEEEAMFHNITWTYDKNNTHVNISDLIEGFLRKEFINGKLVILKNISYIKERIDNKKDGCLMDTVLYIMNYTESFSTSSRSTDGKIKGYMILYALEKYSEREE